MIKKVLLCFLLGSTCFADLNLYKTEEPKISVQNNILAKINTTTISVVDVMKKMDMLLHQNYPQFADSPQARFQFYAASWRPVLMEMIDTELILSDAEAREVKLTDGEIREEMESRFGPGVLATLDKIGLNYDDAWNMVKKDLLVRRMMWFFVQSKAMQSVTPQTIRQSYSSYLQEHPAFQEWTYRVVTLRVPEQKDHLAHEVWQWLSETKQSPESLAPMLKQWEENNPGCSLRVSSEYIAKDQELSESHKTALSVLEPMCYGTPSTQISRADQKTVHRMFYLYNKTVHEAPSFEEMASRLKNELLQQAMSNESGVYLQKLRSHYGFDPISLKETVPEGIQPFALQ